jgi:hypothetical protein
MAFVRISSMSLVLALLSPALFGVAPGALRAQVDSDPNVASIFATWTPGPPPIRLRDFDLRGLLTQEDRALLSQAVDGGRVVIRGGERSGRAGESSGSRMIILFTGAVERATSLPLPDASDVVYIQDGDSFRRYPEDAPVLTRVIELAPGSTANMVLYKMERLADKTTSGEIFIGVR